jgi:uncharacterized protein YegL
MRRLPIYFVLDVSESMIGPNLYRLEEGLGRVVSELRTDPHALETAWLSVIVFAGKVRKLINLTELTAVTAPSLPVGGGTSLGKALTFLMDEIDTNVRRNTADVKGDWKPIVFLITDGKPTDDVNVAVDRWHGKYSAMVTLVAISIGRAADLTILNRLTDADKVLTLDDDSEAGFSRFIKWVTQSVQARSRSVGDVFKEEQLASLDNVSILKKLNLDKPIEMVDESNAYFVSKCQGTKLPYISRYEPVHGVLQAGQMKLATVAYQLVGCYPVKNSYFEMSSDQPNVATLDSSQIFGQPSCPHCGNRIGFAMCSCGNTFCIAGDGQQTCPWCEQTANFGRMTEDAESLELTRARG